MHTCKQPIFFLSSDDGPAASPASSESRSEFSIGEMAADFAVTPRALRFYESKGLLSPRRADRTRLYGQSDRERLSLILKAKKFGFTLLEIKEMIKAQKGDASAYSSISREQCSEQIDLLERQLREIEEALAELRQIHAMLVQPAAGR